MVRDGELQFARKSCMILVLAERARPRRGFFDAHLASPIDDVEGDRRVTVNAVDFEGDDVALARHNCGILAEIDLSIRSGLSSEI